MSIFRRAICAVREKKAPSRRQSKQQQPLPPDERGGDYSAEIPVVGEGIFGRENCYRLLRVLEGYDEGLGREYKEGVAGLGQSDTQLVVLLYNHMLSVYDEQFWCDRDNDGKKGTGMSLQPAQPVPNYYANIQDQTIHRRKVLSIAGLRNLAIYGVEIYRDLAKKTFSGDPSLYRQDQGIHKMRQYTGNTVDLDTTVLRASDAATMKTVNAMNKRAGLPEFGSTKEFGNSDQAAEIARVAAKEHLTRFGSEYNLSKNEVRKRKVDPTELSKQIPIARSNSDRGKHPLWRYVNVGQDSYHCNVPCVEDVTGALLRAPVRAVRVYLRTLLTYKGDELTNKITRFFDECIVDACFNQKWRAIEEYERASQAEGSIVTILQSLQKSHQGQILAVMEADDERYSLEKGVMWSLARGWHGRDINGATRKITKTDVDRWVDDPAVVI